MGEEGNITLYIELNMTNVILFFTCGEKRRGVTEATPYVIKLDILFYLVYLRFLGVYREEHHNLLDNLLR